MKYTFRNFPVSDQPDRSPCVWVKDGPALLLPCRSSAPLFSPTVQRVPENFLIRRREDALKKMTFSEAYRWESRAG